MVLWPASNLLICNKSIFLNQTANKWADDGEKPTRSEGGRDGKAG